MKKPRSIDHYLSGVPEDRRAALEVVRQRIHALLPEIEECISYSMPAFRYNGDVIGGFLATAKGCSYYPFSGKTLRTLGAAVATFGQTSGALHFDPEAPLSAALLKKLLKARIAEKAPPAASKKAAPAAKGDDTWKALKLAAPARRALANSKMHQLSDLARHREADVAVLHGMGPNALAILRTALKKHRLAFRKG